MPSYNLYTGSYGDYESIAYVFRNDLFFPSGYRFEISEQAYYKMRAYLIPSSSYVTWITTGSVDTTGTNSGYPTSSLSDITVLPQYS